MTAADGQHPGSQPPLKVLTPRNMLSFGPDRNEISLAALNVLIGPNGSGKSNLIDAIALLRATPTDMGLRNTIIGGGGASEWIWKGGGPSVVATVDAVVGNPAGEKALWHGIGFRISNQAFLIDNEAIMNADSHPRDPDVYYRFEDGEAILHGKKIEDPASSQLMDLLLLDRFAHDKSILAQRRDPVAFPELAVLSDLYGAIRIYRDWQLGRNAVLRAPQPADLRSDRLEEDFSNLGLFLNRLRQSPRAKRALLTALQDLYAGLDDFDVSIKGGTVQVFLTEGDFSIPATRLSDGTLRYLCLLAILLDPDPPKVVCIEEPELGLHPDILPKLADLLVDASERMQLIVTTHSDIIVDALSEHPDAVLVCEKHEGQTQIRRLQSEPLSVWLEKYRLGDLWTRGEIGGTRW